MRWRSWMRTASPQRSTRCPSPAYLMATMAKAMLARQCNEFWLMSRRAILKAFRLLLAAVPLPDVDGAPAEIAYALDVLKLDAVGLVGQHGTNFSVTRSLIRCCRC